MGVFEEIFILTAKKLRCRKTQHVGLMIRQCCNLLCVAFGDHLQGLNRLQKLFSHIPPPMAQQPLVGQGLLTITDTPHSVGLLRTSDRPVVETSTWQHTALTRDIHATGGIRTHSASKRAAADRRLRPRGPWDRHSVTSSNVYLYTYICVYVLRIGTGGGLFECGNERLVFHKTRGISWLTTC
jgi:hypothetical protein